MRKNADKVSADYFSETFGETFTERHSLKVLLQFEDLELVRVDARLWPKPHTLRKIALNFGPKKSA